MTEEEFPKSIDRQSWLDYLAYMSTSASTFTVTVRKPVTLGHNISTGKPVELGDIERTSGLYVLGRPRMGKSTLLVNCICSDASNGNSLFFLDPHGKAIDDVVARFCATSHTARLDRVLLIDPTDSRFSFGINPLYCADVSNSAERLEAYTKTHNVFRKIWEGEKEWGVWLQRILSNTIYVFIENQDYTIAEMPRFLTNAAFRNHLLKNVKYNMRAVDFWGDEYKREQAESLLTRLDSLLIHDYVRHIVGQKHTTIDFVKYTRDPPWFLFLKLPAHLPQDIKTFIGTIVVSELLHAIRTRPPEARKSLYGVYVDEFQHVATDQFADFILECGKYGCATTVAHQERRGQFGKNEKILGATAAT